MGADEERKQDGEGRTVRNKTWVTATATILLAIDLYEKRLDKDHSLTDCSSMAAMRSLGISEILSTEDHFHQEGFALLLR